MNPRMRNDNRLWRTKMKKSVKGSKETIMRKDQIARQTRGREPQKKTRPKWRASFAT